MLSQNDPSMLAVLAAFFSFLLCVTLYVFKYYRLLPKQDIEDLGEDVETPLSDFGTPFEVIMPIHNEARYLPVTLPSILALNASFYIFLFDRCSDQSEKIVLDSFRKEGRLDKLRCITLSDDHQGYKDRMGHLFELLMNETREDVVFFTGADLSLDFEKILDCVPLISRKMGLISFRYSEGDWRHEWGKKTSRKHGGFNGPYLFWRDFYLERKESLRQVGVSDDSVFSGYIKARSASLHMPSNCYHYRFVFREWQRGFLTWKALRRGWGFALSRTLLRVSPLYLKGYVQARCGYKPPFPLFTRPDPV